MRHVKMQARAGEPARESRLAVGTVLELDRLRFHTQRRREQLPQPCPPHDESAGVAIEGKTTRPVVLGVREQRRRCANGFGRHHQARHHDVDVLAGVLGLTNHGRGVCTVSAKPRPAQPDSLRHRSVALTQRRIGADSTLLRGTRDSRRQTRDLLNVRLRRRTCWSAVACWSFMSWLPGKSAGWSASCSYLRKDRRTPGTTCTLLRCLTAAMKITGCSGPWPPREWARTRLSSPIERTGGSVRRSSSCAADCGPASCIRTAIGRTSSTLAPRGGWASPRSPRFT